MTDEKSTNQESNIYLPSVLGLLLVLIAAAAVWVGQVSPLVAEQAAPEPAVAPVQGEPAPAQVSLGDATVGQTLFSQTCSACHGPTGQGIQNLGKDLTVSQFVAGQTDTELIAFIKVGRGSTDPLNTTGIDMPPKGGNPALNDEDLQNIVAYLRDRKSVV